MGIRRRTNKHLPRRMYLRRGKYYFVDVSGKWHPLGPDYVKAMGAYAELTGPGRPCVTMESVIEKYRLHVLPHKAESTQKHEGPKLTRLASVFGGMLPDDVTIQHVYRYMDARSAAPTAARHEVTLLHHVFVKAIRWGAATKNPAQGIEKPKSKPRDRYVTDEEYLAVWELAIPSLRVAMDLALLTGLRRGDLLNLTRGSLTDDGLLVKSQKTSKALLFEYTEELNEVLSRAKKLRPQLPGRYLIRTREGRQYTGSGFAANWQRLMRKAQKNGIEKFTFHDIRAKSASDSASLREASERLGHTSMAMTDRVYMRTARKVKPLR